MKTPHSLRILAVTATSLVAWLAGCASDPEPVATAPAVQAPSPPVPLAGASVPVKTARSMLTPPPPSNATTALAYRRDAARHLYNQNGHRVYKGKLPPLLHAIGVLQVEVDGRGWVTGTSWMRAPKHAPDVIARGQFGHNPAVGLVQLHLAVQGVGTQDRYAGIGGLDQRHPGFIAR